MDSELSTPKRSSEHSLQLSQQLLYTIHHQNFQHYTFIIRLFSIKTSKHQNIKTKHQNIKTKHQSIKTSKHQNIKT
jgi:hypothetical protein